MIVSLPMPTALKLSCITNFDMFFLVMGVISLVDEIQLMLISSRHIYIRSTVLIALSFEIPELNNGVCVIWNVGEA